LVQEGAELQAQLEKLLHLQGIDSGTADARRRLEALRSGEALEEPRRREEDARRRLESRREKLKKLQHEALRNERESDALVAERKFLEGRMYGGEVTNPKEIERMEKKIEQMKRDQGELEEKALAAMDEAEAVREGLDDLRSEAERARETLAEAESRAAGEIEKVEEELEHLAEARSEAVEGIDSELLEEYERLRQKKGGVAIAAVVNGACDGCRVSLSVIVANRVRRNEGVVYCENCGRMLCWTGEED